MPLTQSQVPAACLLQRLPYDDCLIRTACCLPSISPALLPGLDYWTVVWVQPPSVGEYAYTVAGLLCSAMVVKVQVPAATGERPISVPAAGLLQP